MDTLSNRKLKVLGVTLDPSTATLTAGGDAVKLTATVAPDDATDKKVKWSVGGSAVTLYSDKACTTEVGTDATATLTVYAKGVSAGKVTVFVNSNADSNKAADCNVFVTPSVSITPEGAGTVAFAVKYDVDLRLTATANSGYEFDHWSWSENETEKTSTSNPGTWLYYFDHPANIKDLTAHFKADLTPVTITAADKEVTYSADGIAIPVDGMFTITEGAGAATYTVENGTGEGTFTEGKLTVTKCGTFTVKVSTAATATHAAGAETTVTLTVNKAASSVKTAPTIKTVTYSGQAQELVTAGTAEGGRTFRIIKVHNGEPSVIDGTYDASTGIYTFETDSFSSYAIAYKDGEDEGEDEEDDDEPAQTTAAPSTTPRAPKTGDDMMGYSFWLMLAAAGLAVSGMAAKGRKEQE